MPTVMANHIVGVQPMDSDVNSMYPGIFNQFFDKQFNKKYWPYQYNVGREDRWDTERWCYSNFKSRNWNSYRNQFVFKRKEDAMLFALRWT
jgi:hypothetical protein